MKPWLITFFSLIVLLAVGGAGYVGLRRADPAAVGHEALPTPVTVPVTRGAVQQTVTAPGQLVGTREVILGLKVEGQLAELKVQPGSTVQQGEVLATLDPQPFIESLSQAQLRLDVAQKRQQEQLAEAKLQVEIAAARLKQAQGNVTSLTAAQASLVASQTELQQLLEGPSADEITVAAADLQQSQIALRVAQQAYDQVAYADNLGTLPEAIALQAATLDYEAKLAAYNLASKGPTEADLANVRATVEQAQAEVQAAVSALAAHQQEVAILEFEVEQARLQVEQLQTGVDPLLRQAVQQAEQDLANTSLIAPFAGVVLEIFGKPGQRISRETALLLLADPTATEVRTKVVEEDLPLVQIGQATELFFDAQPLEAIPGRVSRLVPQRIAGEDRPLYYVYITPDFLPSGVVAGMTADASIIIAQRLAVLRLPRALVRPNSQGLAVVDVWEKGQQSGHEVQVGLRGDVYVEIMAGLAEGEEIVGE